MNNILPSVKKIQQSQLCVALNISILHTTTSQSNSWLLCYSLIDLQLCNFHNHSKVALQTNAWVSKCPFESQQERRSLNLTSHAVCVWMPSAVGMPKSNHRWWHLQHFSEKRCEMCQQSAGPTEMGGWIQHVIEQQLQETVADTRAKSRVNHSQCRRILIPTDISSPILP